MGLYPIYRSVNRSFIRAKWQGARALCVSTQRSSCVMSMNGAGDKSVESQAVMILMATIGIHWRVSAHKK